MGGDGMGGGREGSEDIPHDGGVVFISGVEFAKGIDDQGYGFGREGGEIGAKVVESGGED